MAVGKIRKISSWTMLISVVISGIVFGLFYFGGDEALYKGKYWNPAYLETLLFWLYAMLTLCVGGMLLFAVMQFASSFTRNVKGSIASLAVLGGFVLLMILAYSMGDATPMAGINASSQMYNTEFWLKLSDMWIYALYIMLTLATLLIIAGSVKKSLNK